MKLIYSEELSRIFTEADKRSEADLDCEDRYILSDACDMTCSTGYQADGSTCLEIFQNGFELAKLCGPDDDVFYGVNDDAYEASFVIAKSEGHATLKMRDALLDDALNKAATAIEAK